MTQKGKFFSSYIFLNVCFFADIRRVSDSDECLQRDYDIGISSLEKI